MRRKCLPSLGLAIQQPNFIVSMKNISDLIVNGFFVTGRMMSFLNLRAPGRNVSSLLLLLCGAVLARGNCWKIMLGIWENMLRKTSTMVELALLCEIIINLVSVIWVSVNTVILCRRLMCRHSRAYCINVQFIRFT